MYAEKVKDPEWSPEGPHGSKINSPKSLISANKTKVVSAIYEIECSVMALKLFLKQKCLHVLVLAFTFLTFLTS